MGTVMRRLPDLLFLSNLDFMVTREQLCELIWAIDPTARIKMPFNTDPKINRGFAFINCANGEKVIKKLHNLRLRGRKIKLKVYVKPEQTREPTE